MTPITSEMYEAFDERTKAHVEQVKYFGRISGYYFTDHDKTKWDADKVRGFVISNAITNMSLEPDEEDLQIRELAIFNHVKSEPHHPAYWDANCYWENYHLNPKGFHNSDEFDDTAYQIDARRMEKESMVEMCADWCAVSDELGKDPHSWAKMNVGTRWIFSEEQEKFIYQSLDTMWNTHLKTKLRVTDSGTIFQKMKNYR